MLGLRANEYVQEPFESRVSVSYSPLVLLDVSATGFQSQMFWELVFLVQIPRAWCGTQTPWSSGWSSVFVMSLLLVSHNSGGEGPGKTTSLFLPPISTWLFFLCHLLRKSCFAGLQVLFRENCSICSCSYRVTGGGGELRIFLCLHLELLPLGVFLKVF